MRRKLLLGGLAAALMSGCAAMAVKEDALYERTEVALGLERADFTISNRKDSSIRTDYVATTKAGKVFNCYVGGGMSIFGRVVTEAICTEKGKPSSATSRGSGLPFGM